MIEKTFLTKLILMCSLLMTASGFTRPASAAEDCLTPDRRLSLRGTIIQTAFTDYNQGKPFQQQYTAIAFERPRCAISEMSGYKNNLLILQVTELDARWVGHHVLLDALVQDNGGTIHYPTIVSLKTMNIKDIEPGAAPVVAQQPNGENPEAFIRNVLARDLSTVLNANDKVNDDKTFISADMVALLSRYGREFDVDVYTGTQDNSGFAVDKIVTNSASQFEAVVSASFSTGLEASPRWTLSYYLKRSNDTSGSWKIVDVKYHDGEMLSTLLKNIASQHKRF